MSAYREMFRVLGALHSDALAARVLAEEMIRESGGEAMRVESAIRAAITCLSDAQKIMLGDPMEEGGETWSHK